MIKVVIIGGGPSGLLSAYSASKNGYKVILLEKNGECGKKLNICGKGRGNITNTANIEEFIQAFGKNGSFLYSAFSQFSNNDLIHFLNNNNIETVIERGGRVFPKSQKANDITKFLVSIIKDSVNIRYGTPANNVITENHKIIGVKIHDGIIKCDKVIIATGGMSYPKCGSTGDGYAIAKDLGHTINEIKPSICPIICDLPYLKSIAGLSLKNVEVSLLFDKKIIRKEFGEMLWTHTGVSGPIILTISKYISELGLSDKLRLVLDLKPALSIDELYNKFTKEFRCNITIKNYFAKILPKSLSLIFPLICNIDENKKVNIITKEEKKVIANQLKNIDLKIKALSSIDEAIITKGGVDIKEINPKTMESKIISGLYFCGELIDIDAKTGGYNLQAAFSTGYVAGKLMH